ncbi:MAG: hypothetical protein V7749_01150 [Cocleimonas sp.]
MIEKIKKTLFVMSCFTVFYSNVAIAGLENMTSNGDEVEVSDNDLVTMLINAGGTFIAILCGLICVYGLIQMVWDTWKNIKEFRAGKIDTLGGALEPLFTNGFMVIISFAVGVYITSNFTGWLT